MTNSTLREQFGLENSKGPQITRIINAAVEEKLIRKKSDSEAKSEAKNEYFIRKRLE